MSDQDIQLEQALLDAALGLTDVTARGLFLDRACAGNTALRARLDQLLEDHARAETFFDFTPTVPFAGGAAAFSPETTGRASDVAELIDGGNDPVRIGRYRIVRRLGSGGCGIVYLAAQDEPVRREVALKLIRLGMDTERVIARFALERQALALMNHPYIARVLDAGVTDSGRPFFVMELVLGERITDFCESRRLSLRERLELFILVCQAVQHAHQKGILHRDLKPSNVLVALQDGAPVPKIIDFGVAKAVSSEAEDFGKTIAVEHFIGTPAYMSPEQAEPGRPDVDTRSDLYSLGALLYELLTGQPPFDTQRLLAAGLDELRRILREEEPLSPSIRVQRLPAAEQAALSGRLGCTPSVLLQALRRDLDWIVLQALAKDRQRRYVTVQGLAIDLRRYLDDEPVSARPPSRRYRVQKLVRRNRAVFGSIMAVSLALIAGFGTSTRLFFKERQARLEAQRGREAEAREIIAQAMSLIERNQFDKADLLVEPLLSSDAADVGMEVFRPLADRAAQQGNWRRAAEYYSVVVRLDRFERTGVSSRDYTRYAVVLAELGDRAAYEHFCREPIARFGQSNDLIITERVVKSSLLLPPSPELLASLVPLADRIERSIPADVLTARYNDTVPWRCLALALMNYRSGDYAGAVKWSTLGLKLATGPSLSRVASMRAIGAMAHHQLDHRAEARAELAECQQVIAENFKTQFATADIAFDWFLARLLEREAAAYVGGGN
jgi:serine/threonine protein kinase